MTKPAASTAVLHRCGRVNWGVGCRRDLVAGVYRWVFFTHTVHLNGHKVLSESWEQYLALDILLEDSLRPSVIVNPGEESQSTLLLAVSFPPYQDAVHWGPL